MDAFIFDPEHEWLKAANEAFDREFQHTDAMTDDDVRKVGAEVCDVR